MDIPRYGKYAPLVKKLHELMRDYKQPQTPEEWDAESKRDREEHKALWEEKRARGELKDFEARLEICKTPEEEGTLLQEQSEAITEEVRARRNPELRSVTWKICNLLLEDGKFQGFMTPEEIEFFRKKTKEGLKVCERIVGRMGHTTSDGET